MFHADPTFMQAFTTVRKHHSDEEWLLMSPQQITREIYDEVRRLDRMRLEMTHVMPEAAMEPVVATSFSSMHSRGDE